MSASKPEPPPIKTKKSRPFIQNYVEYLRSSQNPVSVQLAELVEERRAFGVEKYKTELHTFNGRDCIEDARQEFGDLVVYLWQGQEEGREEEVAEFIKFVLEVLK